MRYRAQQSYQSFDELLVDAPADSYQILTRYQNSSVAFIAPHGGFTEPKTSEICRAAAGDDYSFAIFNCLDIDRRAQFHIPSHLFDEPECLRLVKRTPVVIAIHGCLGDDEQIFVGGLHEPLIEIAKKVITERGFTVSQDDRYLGRHPNNICNQGTSGCGLQLEITRALRDQLFIDEEWWRAETPTLVFWHLVESLKLIATRVL